jgi:hypothetical protein
MPAPRIHIIGLESAPRPEATHRWLAVRRARRTTARSFVNDIAPDPLAYAGQKREPILVSVGQSICWVISRSWSELPELTENTACGPDFPGIGSRDRVARIGVAGVGAPSAQLPRRLLA